MSLKGINILSVDKLFSCYCLYYIGMLLSNVKAAKIERPLVCAITFAVCFAALCFLNKMGSISLGDNDYVNPVFMLAASVLGWFLTYSISALLEKVSPLKAVLSLLGKHSIIIVIFHFLCFKPVNLLVAAVNHWPVQTVAGFPVSCNTGCWWILYTFVSAGLCLLIAVLWEQIKNRHHILRCHQDQGSC